MARRSSALTPRQRWHNAVAIGVRRDLLVLTENKGEDDYEHTSQDILPVVAVAAVAADHAQQLQDQQGV